MDHQGKEIVFEVPPFFYLYKDGSARRCPREPLVAPSPEPQDDGVASKDIILDADLGLWARIFRPHSHDDEPGQRLLPVVLYFHGGGFVFGSPAWSNFHAFCADMAKRSASIWVSASYRLAPEHRLPAALDDSFANLRWLHAQALLQAGGETERMDAWLARADFSKCFLAGESAGGTIAHHVAMRAMNPPSSSSSWEPLCIHGLILIHPGFVRATRTEEEINCAQDMLMNWSLADACLGLALPLGATLDHPFMNPLPALSSEVSFVLPRTLVALADKDGLHFMGLEYVRALEDSGCHVDLVMSHGVGHVFFIAQPESEQAQILMERITSFISKEQ